MPKNLFFFFFGERKDTKTGKNNKKVKSLFSEFTVANKSSSITDKIQQTAHSRLIDKIYFGKNSEVNNLTLSSIANVAERTCYRYRVEYVDCFYTCFNMLLN